MNASGYYLMSVVRRSINEWSEKPVNLSFPTRMSPFHTNFVGRPIPASFPKIFFVEGYDVQNLTLNCCRLDGSVPIANADGNGLTTYEEARVLLPKGFRNLRTGLLAIPAPTCGRIGWTVLDTSVQNLGKVLQYCFGASKAHQNPEGKLNRQKRHKTDL